MYILWYALSIKTMLNLKQKKIIQILVLLFIVLVPVLLKADGLVPCGGEGESPCSVADSFVLVARLTNWLLRVAGIYATYKIIQSGFWLAVSQGDSESITTNKKRMTDTILGFCLVMMAYMLVNTIVNFMFLKNIKECIVDWNNPLSYLEIQDNKCSPDK